MVSLRSVRVQKKEVIVVPYILNVFGDGPMHNEITSSRISLTNPWGPKVLGDSSGFGHKLWSNVQRGVTSGIIAMHDIGHHLILKTNVRIGGVKEVSPFLTSSWVSWHFKLVDFVNEIQNNFSSFTQRR